MTKSVILVDDDKLVLDAQFRLLTRRQPSWQLRSANDGNDALKKLEQMPAQVAVIDMCMPHMDGMELAKRLRQRWPDMLVIMLTGHADLSTVIAAINQGSSCELSAAIKLAANDGAVRAIRLSHLGEGRAVTAAISPSRAKDGSIVGAVITLVDSTKAPTPNAHALSDIFGLTPAEAKLSSALATGQSLECASAGLQITVSSARTYLKAIFQKTGASRQAELVHVILNSAAAFLPASI